MEEVEKGLFVEVSAAQEVAKRGINLGVTRASNKGTVGIPFRYHDVSIGFMSSHFASDSKGVNKIEKRNMVRNTMIDIYACSIFINCMYTYKDARAALQDITLISDDVGFDAQLTVQVGYVHHYVYTYIYIYIYVYI
jgi:hypothetical protein